MRDFIYSCPERVFNDHTLTLNEFRVYLIYRSFMDSTDDDSYPSKVDLLKKKFDIDESEVFKCIDNLVEKGYMEKEIYDF